MDDNRFNQLPVEVRNHILDVCIQFRDGEVPGAVGQGEEFHNMPDWEKNDILDAWEGFRMTRTINNIVYTYTWDHLWENEGDNLTRTRNAQHPTARQWLVVDASILNTIFDAYVENGIPSDQVGGRLRKKKSKRRKSKRRKSKKFKKSKKSKKRRKSKTRRRRRR